MDERTGELDNRFKKICRRQVDVVELLGQSPDIVTAKRDDIFMLGLKVLSASSPGLRCREPDSQGASEDHVGVLAACLLRGALLAILTAAAVPSRSSRS